MTKSELLAKGQAQLEHEAGLVSEGFFQNLTADVYRPSETACLLLRALRAEAARAAPGATPAEIGAICGYWLAGGGDRGRSILDVIRAGPMGRFL